MRRWILGTVLVSLGLGWLIADRILVTSEPGRWGGPNIGAGGLVVLAFGNIAGGIVTLVNAASGRRRGKVAVDDLSQPARIPQGVRVAGLAVIGVLVLALATTRILTHGDRTGPDINGQVGVSVSAAGDPVLLLRVCHGSATVVTVVGPNLGNVPNKTLAELTTAEPVTDYAAVDVAHPPAHWVGQAVSLRGPLAQLSLVIASASDGRSANSSELAQVSFTSADLRSLRPGTVLFGSGRHTTNTIDEFRQGKC